VGGARLSMFGSVGWWLGGETDLNIYSLLKRKAPVNSVCTKRTVHGVHEFFIEQDFQGVGSGMKNGFPKFALIIPLHCWEIERSPP